MLPRDLAFGKEQTVNLMYDAKTTMSDAINPLLSGLSGQDLLFVGLFVAITIAAALWGHDKEEDK